MSGEEKARLFLPACWVTAVAIMFFWTQIPSESVVLSTAVLSMSLGLMTLPLIFIVKENPEHFVILTGFVYSLGAVDAITLLQADYGGWDMVVLEFSIPILMTVLALLRRRNALPGFLERRFSSE